MRDTSKFFLYYDKGSCAGPFHEVNLEEFGTLDAARERAKEVDPKYGTDLSTGTCRIFIGLEIPDDAARVRRDAGHHRPPTD